jgi:hypothetical protein
MPAFVTGSTGIRRGTLASGPKCFTPGHLRNPYHTQNAPADPNAPELGSISL